MNNAGGYSYKISPWEQAKRFLVLGTEGGTYYVSERELTLSNAKTIKRLAHKDGVRLVQLITEISESGRAPKNDPALFALAVAIKYGDLETRRAAYAAVPKVARTGTHFLHLVDFVRSFGVTGRGWRTAQKNWFLSKTPDQLAYQLMKYQSRDGWSMRDVLRMARPKGTGLHQELFRWVVRGWDDIPNEAPSDEVLARIWAVETLKRTQDKRLAVNLIADYRLPREVVPTELLREPEVWEALLPNLGFEGMIRNLATMTRVGLIAPFSQATAYVRNELRNQERIKKSRIHPIKVLAALLTYKSGQGVRGSNTWTPVQPIVDDLDQAFYASFGNVTPIGKPVVLALDKSASMFAGEVAGVPGLTPGVAAAAMALVTANVEPNYHIMLFDTSFRPAEFSPRWRLDQVVDYMRRGDFCGTDCSLPMQWARGYSISYRSYKRDRRLVPGIEGFVVYTDNDTWAGAIHPSEALRAYREEAGVNSKLVVVGMTATRFSIADPNDRGMIDVVGFDTAAPEMISDFIRGDI